MYQYRFTYTHLFFSIYTHLFRRPRELRHIIPHISLVIIMQDVALPYGWHLRLLINKENCWVQDDIPIITYINPYKPT